MRRWLPLALLVGCASWSTTFTPADRSWKGQARENEIDVFLYSPPARPYQVVGVIVVLPPGPAGMNDLVARAVEKARAVGCDLLILKSLAHGALRRPILVAQRVEPGKLPAGGTIGVTERGPRRGDFVCGVYSTQ